MKKGLKRVLYGGCALAFVSAFFVTYAKVARADTNSFVTVPYQNVTSKYSATSLRAEHFNESVIFAGSVPNSTGAYASYYNGDYAIPFGTYVYRGDGAPTANEKYNAVSAYSESGYENGFATTGIYSVVGEATETKSVKYTLSDSFTGRLLYSENVQATPFALFTEAKVGISTVEHALVANRAYKIAVDYSDTQRCEYAFTADYIAPTLEGLRLDYHDYKENGLDKKRAYLEMDLHDNHYAQAVMLCYKDGEKLRLATQTPTPVLQEDKNSKTTVRIDVTDIIGREEKMYISVDDYALNNTVYRFTWTDLTNYMQPKWGFSLIEDEEEITIAKNETHAVQFTISGDFHRTHFIWESANESVAKVKDGVIVGVGAGTTEIRAKVSHSDKYTQTVSVTVTDEEVLLPNPVYTVDRNALTLREGEKSALRVFYEPWYYPQAGVTYAWTTSDEDVATVQNGVVQAVACGEAVVCLEVYTNGIKTHTVAVDITVTDGFSVRNGMLVAYEGKGYNEGDLSDGTAKLVLPQSVKRIGANVFANNQNIQQIVLPDGIRYIGDGAFRGCKQLQSVTIGENTSLGKNVFAGCSALEEVNWGGACVSAGALRDLGALKTVNFTGNGALAIGVRAFANSGKKNGITVTFGERTVTEIGAGAFENATLTSDTFTLPDGLQKLGEGAFAGSNVRTVEISDGVAWNGLRLTGLQVSIVTGSTEYAIEDGILYSVDREEKTLVAVVGEKTGALDLRSTNVTRIANYAFAGSGITEVTLSENTKIDGLGEGAFAYSALQTFSFNDVAVTALPASLFEGTKLTSIWLPSTVQTIGASAFRNCESLASVTGAEGVKTVEANAFEGCITLSAFGGAGGLVNLQAVEYIGARAFFETVLKGDLVLTEAVVVGDEAFKTKQTYGGYTLVSIPKMKSIGARAFAGGAYESIELPLGVKEIGEGAFASMSLNSALKGIRFENGKTDNGTFFVKDGVLYRYTNEAKTRFGLLCYPTFKGEVKQFTVPEGTARIGALAFYSMKNVGIDAIVLPKTLESIGERAFYQSGIGTFTFNGLRAPILEATHSEQVDEQVARVVASNGKGYYKGLYYMNFNVRFVNLLGDYTDNVVGVGRTIYYPENGVGYDHWVYVNYFQNRKTWGVQASEDTQKYLETVYALPTKAEFAVWDGAEVNEENTAKLQELIAQVATARLYYDNALKDSAQAELLTVADLNRLLDAEKALRAIKARFGIPVNVVRVEYVKGSAKETYMVDDTFDLTGALVKVFYDDGSVVETGEGIRIKENNKLNVYDAHVELVYSISGKEYTTYAVINVTDPKEVVVVEKVDRTLGIIFTAVGGVIVLAGAFIVFQPYFKARKKEKI